MKEDIESNFWKEHFTHLQHKNMTRTDAKRLEFSQVMSEIQAFAKEHPEIQPVVENHGSYITWEVFVTPQIKLRLFFQYQIKGSLLQLQQKEFVKIADAKFPYNPFYEVGEFLSKTDSYVEELEKEKKDSLKANMEIKIAGEFIKSYIQKKFSEKPEIIWNLKADKDCYQLTLQFQKIQKSCNISFDNFISDIDSFCQSAF